MMSDLKWWLHQLNISGFYHKLLPRGPCQDMGLFVDASTSWGIGIIVAGRWAAFREVLSVPPVFHMDSTGLHWTHSTAKSTHIIYDGSGVEWIGVHWTGQSNWSPYGLFYHYNVQLEWTGLHWTPLDSIWTPVDSSGLSTAKSTHIIYDWSGLDWSGVHWTWCTPLLT